MILYWHLEIPGLITSAGEGILSEKQIERNITWGIPSDLMKWPIAGLWGSACLLETLSTITGSKRFFSGKVISADEFSFYYRSR
ncbi:MAG: hypothetical protein GY786_09370 [Proteobacteria bacterium]|nr:hypothetical protein [Pseudomonadota bacterium]